MLQSHRLGAGAGRYRRNRAPGDLWRAGSARGKQGKSRSSALSRRDVAGAGMGPGHVGCTAQSSFRLLLWARCHGQAGKGR